MTGSAGFIGSHATEALIDAGWSVMGLDSLDPYYDVALKRRNLDEIARRADGSFEFVDADITSPSQMQSAFNRFRPDAVLHLAARAGVRPSIQNPAGYAVTNVVGTQNVLDAANGSGCKRIICASSSSVYGNNPKTPFAEIDRIDAPISPYAATKKASELIAFTHHHLTGANVGMLRFFTVFGPRQRPDLAIRLFLSRIAQGEQIHLFGDGSTSRDYTYVQDIVAGVLAALDRIDSFGYRVWNLGGDHPVSLGELVEIVGEVAGQTPIIERRPMQPGDVQRTWADLTRAREELGYAPGTSVPDGVRAQFEWMRANGDV